MASPRRPPGAPPAFAPPAVAGGAAENAGAEANAREGGGTGARRGAEWRGGSVPGRGSPRPPPGAGSGSGGRADLPHIFSPIFLVHPCATPHHES